MAQNGAIVLEAPSGDPDAAELQAVEMEATLQSLMQLGLVTSWLRLADSSYRVEVDGEIMEQLSVLGWTRNCCPRRAPESLE